MALVAIMAALLPLPNNPSSLHQSFNHKVSQHFAITRHRIETRSLQVVILLSDLQFVAMSFGYPRTASVIKNVTIRIFVDRARTGPAGAVLHRRSSQGRHKDFAEQGRRNLLVTGIWVSDLPAPQFCSFSPFHVTK